MQNFIASCDKSLNYPINLTKPGVLQHSLQAYHTRLNQQAKILFDSETRATVNFLDRYEDGNQEFVPAVVQTLVQLIHHLRRSFDSERGDPSCRFVFVHAPHSRAKLRISLDMFNFLLSYHEVMPSYLDFVFPFGQQTHKKDFHFSGLREESPFIHHQTIGSIPELGRSGKEWRLCYNLRSVEESSTPDEPWSIRQAAIYQTFDLESGRTLWIVVKGNKVIQKRITDAVTSHRDASTYTRERSLSSVLATHLMICDWAGENWRWYINDLEHQLQRLAGHALTVPPGSPSQIDTAFEPPLIGSQSRANTMPLASPTFEPGSPCVGTGRFPLRAATAPLLPMIAKGSTTAAATSVNDTSVIPRSCGTTLDHDCGPRSKFDRLTASFGTICATVLKFETRWGRRCGGSCSGTPDLEMNAKSAPEDEINTQMVPPAMFPDEDQQNAEKAFRFSDLQKLQHIEEKAQEALLVLGLNTNVLQELGEHYRAAVRHTEFPADLAANCYDGLIHFDRHIMGVTKDLQLLQSRTQNLLQLIGNRKNLLNDMLQYRSVKAGEQLAKEAAMSSHRMEVVTHGMYTIAEKTKEETSSMKIITSVSVTLTLFFLPATFTATFMSTNILDFSGGKKNFQQGGLNLFLQIALPMTAVTFFVWWLIYRLARRKENPR